MRDDHVFEDLYKSYAPSVFRRARQLLGQDADAYEIVQELFLSIFEHPEQYQGRSVMMTFLYSATTHACLNRIRNGKNRERLRHDHFLSDESTTASRLTPEQAAMLHRAIQALPDDIGQAAIYFAIDGMTHQEIAEVMHCSRRHVGDLLARAADWLRNNEGAPC